MDDDEWAFVRRHPLIGERIIGAAPALAQAAKLVRATHERVDGSGYPDGLAGEQIPLGARIIAVCDAFTAMTSPRPYAAQLTFRRPSPSCNAPPAPSSTPQWSGSLRRGRTAPSATSSSQHVGYRAAGNDLEGLQRYLTRWLSNRSRPA